MDPRNPDRPDAPRPRTNMRCHRAIGLLMSLLLMTTGCTSIRSFEGARLERLKLGELVTIYEASGRVSRLYVSAITEEAIKGHYHEGGPIVSIPRSDIDAVEVERTDYAKTTVAGVGGVVVAAAAVVVGFFMLFVMAAGASS